MPTGAHRHTAGRGQIRAERAEQQQPVELATTTRTAALSATTPGSTGCSDHEDRAEQDRDGRPGAWSCCGGVQVEEQGGAPEAGPEDDTCRQVAARGAGAPRSASMAPRPDGDGHEAPKGLAPTRKAPEPPAVPTSPRAWPAKDWPRMTVNTPTTAETTATSAPDRRAPRAPGSLAKNPGSNTARSDRRSSAQPSPRGEAVACRRSPRRGGLVLARPPPGCGRAR